MNILITGPEHSATRLWWGLIASHPDVGIEATRHSSYPSQDAWPGIPSDIHQAVWCTRDRSCTAASQRRSYESVDAAWPIFLEQVCSFTPPLPYIIVSIEAYIMCGRAYLYQVYEQLGLETEGFDYPQGTYDLGPAMGTVDLAPKDTNVKYYAQAR